MNQPPESLNILYLGMHGIFSIPPLRALIDADLKPAALITPPPPGSRRMFYKLNYPAPAAGSGPEKSLYGLAAQHGIPIYEISRLRNPEAMTLLETLDSDFIIVACFNRLLPRPWLDAPRKGCINLHPSLLPAYRGPTPLEDQIANGETYTGITLHFMDEGADTGDIIVQEQLQVPENATLESLNQLTAREGARLLLEVLQRPDDIPRRPQEP